jgi:hypothetical protein
MPRLENLQIICGWRSFGTYTPQNLEFLIVQPDELLRVSDFLGQCILRGVLRTHNIIEKPNEEHNTEDFHLLSKQLTVRTAILSDQELGSMPIIIKNNDQKIIQLGSARWHWVCDRSDLFVYCRSWRKGTCLRKFRRLLWIVFVDWAKKSLDRAFTYTFPSSKYYNYSTRNPSSTTAGCDPSTLMCKQELRTCRPSQYRCESYSTLLPSSCRRFISCLVGSMTRRSSSP